MSTNASPTPIELWSLAENPIRLFSPELDEVEQQLLRSFDELELLQAELLEEQAALATEREALIAERDAMTAERAALASERATLASDNEALSVARDALATRHQEFAAEQSRFSSAQASLAAEQTNFAEEQANFAAERANFTAELNHLATEQTHFTTEQANFAAEKASFEAARLAFAAEQAEFFNQQQAAGAAKILDPTELLEWEEKLVASEQDLETAREQLATQSQWIDQHKMERMQHEELYSVLEVELEHVRNRAGELFDTLACSRSEWDIERNAWDQERKELQALLANQQSQINDYLVRHEIHGTEPSLPTAESGTCIDHSAKKEDTIVVGSVLAQFERIRNERAVRRRKTGGG